MRVCVVVKWSVCACVHLPLLPSIAADSVVLEGTQVFRRDGQGSLPAVCHWHVARPPARVFLAGGDEWATEVSDPP